MNLSIILVIPIILILVVSSSSPNPKTCAHAAAADLSDSSTDLQALLSFKSQLSDPHGALLSWNNKSLNHCRWPGVTCSSNTTGRVVALDLDSLALNGTISPYIGNLTFLTRIRLPNNSLCGGIPRELGNLSQLQHLNLSMNSLGGPIPTTLSQCSLLQSVRLHDNKLEGPIPSTLSRCLNLSFISLSVNSLSGEIPEGIATLSNLVYLNLSNNKLTGKVPSLLGSVTELTEIDLSWNQITGEIPPTLGDCVLLQSLRMEGNYFTGKIPGSFKNLSSIQELDLSRNSLSGQIPKLLQKLTSLQYLNLSFNELEGEVPLGGPFGDASVVSLDGNRRLCGGNPMLHLPPCNSESSARPMSHTLKIMIPVAAIVILILNLGLMGAFCYLRRVSGEKTSSISGSKEKTKPVSYLDISRATNGFSGSKLIGKGSFGNVYRANMNLYEDTIAVKVFNLEKTGGLKSFIAECEALRTIRHRNLVKIVTACSSADPMGNDFKALLFEYMANGSLEEWMHHISHKHSCRKKLNLNQRLNIALDVASAMCYLHHGCDVPLVHCDLKPSNILLDNDMVAHVGDFGLARFLDTSEVVRSKNSMSLMGMKGSIGYIAPEYGTGGQVSTQGDVYSYGVILLQLLTGKKPTDVMFQNGLSLHKYVELAVHQEPWEVLDPALLTTVSRVANASYRKRCTLSLARLGLLCSKESPRERITMQDVVAQLEAVNEMYSMVEDDVNAFVGHAPTHQYRP